MHTLLTFASSLVGYCVLTSASSARVASATSSTHRHDVGTGGGGGSGSAAFILPDAGTGFVSLSSPNRIHRHSIQELSKHTRRSSIISSSKSSDNDSTSRKNRSKGTRSSASPFPAINDAFAIRQITNIFGSISSGSSSGDTSFIPLSLAGRWTSSLSSNNQTSPSSSSGSRIDTIWLSTKEECTRIANAYEQCLKSGDGGSNNSRMQTTITGLPIPLSPALSPSSMKLLSLAYSSKPLSKTLLLIFNSLLVNRDGGLFDNLPWSKWTIDPARYEKDAADNVLDAKYTMGKRVAYQRFMGKDWKGRSFSLGNLANRLRYLLEKDVKEVAGDAATERKGRGVGNEKLQPSSTEYYNDGIQGMQSWLDEEALVIGGGNEDDSAGMMLSLSRRLLELEIKEATMEIAECEQQLAIISTANSRGDVENDATNDGDDREASASTRLEQARERLQVVEASLKEVMEASSSPPSTPGSDKNEGKSTSFFPMMDIFPWSSNAKKGETKKRNTNTQSLLLSIIDKLTEQDNPPPYRGAIGYPPILDSKQEMVGEQSILPYSSPYELLLEIIDEQLNSVVLGCVLEQTSLLEGNLVLGGALLLQRKGVPKSSTVLGEVVSYTDEDDDLRNDGVLPKSMYVVECFPDEAVGMALASGMPLFVEVGLYERAGRRSAELDVESVSTIATYGNATSDDGVGAAMNRIPPIRPLEGSFFSLQTEGDRVSSAKESDLVRIPLTTNPSIFDGFPQTTSSTTSRPVFSTFSPVSSLDEYDALSDDAKARLLLKLDSFTGSLPRPRAVRTSISASSQNMYDDGSSPPSILDKLLVPLIDESIRRQFRIRDAERRKDYVEADELRAKISPRQAALEKAQRALDEGFVDEAIRMEEEAELYKALRADVTQDEFAYDRFLDRDEWYERETRARLKRLDKSKFGTLLDGVDLP